jgi:hypothetical protein
MLHGILHARAPLHYRSASTLQAGAPFSQIRCCAVVRFPVDRCGGTALDGLLKSMSTYPKSHFHIPTIGAQFLFAAISMAVLSRSMAADTGGNQFSDALNNNASRTAPTKMSTYTVDEQQSTKTHTLFMGADIAINLDKDLYRVRDVFGSNWVIEINGQEKEISAKQAPLNLKITPSLKLTEASATIVGFTRVQAYSFANDPSVLLTRGLNHAESMNADLQAIAENAQHRLDAQQNAALGGAALFAGADDQFSANALMATAKYDGAATHPGKYLGVSGAVPTSNSNTTGSFSNDPATASRSVNVGLAQTASVAAAAQTENGNEPAGKIVTGGLDAMDVTFDIRSGRPLQNPYVVTMTKFRVNGSKPGLVQNMVYARSLHPIDEHLSHVHFIEEGFPFGYELIDFQLHIYNRGEEIATNVASNRVELTRDEAFEYVRMEYLGSHKDATLPATAAMAKLPADLPAKLATGKYNQAFYVRVSKEGYAVDAFTDPACTRKIDDSYLASVVDRVRFKPALKDGKPVDGVATLNLNKLPI